MQLVLPGKRPAWKAKTSGEIQPPKARHRFRKKYIVIPVLVIGLVVVGAIGTKALFFSTPAQVALTEMTTFGSLSTTLEGTGITIPADSLTVTAASTASIERVYVSAGDVVQVGDLLYQQDDSELDDLIEEYQDQIAELQTDLQSSYDKRTELQGTMAKLTVTAPFSGRITELSVEEGDSVTSGTKLAVLVDDGSMELTQYFSYVYEDQISVGMEAGVSIASLMTTLPGTVSGIEKVDRVTTEGTHCFAVTISLENPGALTEGMTGAGYLISSTGERIYPSIEGELKYCGSKTLTAKVQGELLAVNPVDYQQVTEGQTLFVVDGSDLTSQLATVDKQITQAEQRIASYQDKIAEVEEKRSEYTVTSDIAGKVIMVAVRAGEKPRQAGQTAVTIYNLDTMTVTANIDELDIDSIEKGMSVRLVRSGAESDEVYQGTITEISYEATNSNGVAYFPVTIEIPSQGALSAGVNVSYYITVGDESEGVLAPISALKNTSAGVCLFVKADTRPENAVDLEEGVVPEGFYAVPVETGISNSKYIRILSGIEQDVEAFTRYQQSAPSGGDSTSQKQNEEQQSENQNNGAPPNFNGEGGMPGGMQGGPMMG